MAYRFTYSVYIGHLQTLFTLNDDYEIFQDNELLINYVLI